MTSASDPLLAIIEGARLVRAVDRVRRGHLRIETPFCLPDNSFVDVYLPRAEGDGPGALTDFGATVDWLRSAGVELRGRRRDILKGTLDALDVEFEGEALRARFDAPQALPDAIVRLGQACSRVADLIFTRRARRPSSFREDVGIFLETLPIRVEAKRTLKGARGPVVVDFVAFGGGRDSAILTLTSRSRGHAVNAAKAVFAKWYDLRGRDEQRLTVFDDRFEVYERGDLDRLGDVSLVLPASARGRLRERLMAA